MPQPTQFDKAWYDFLDGVAGSFYNAIGAVRARTNQIVPLSPLLAVRAGYAESPGWFMVQAAEFDPEPLTVESLRVRDTYGSDPVVRSLLELMASEKWFDRSARQEYLLTEAGREMLAQIFARRRGWIQALDAVDAPLEPLVPMLRSLIQGSCSMEHAWCVNHSRRRAHWQEISPLGCVFQAMEDFNAARDDAHMAAWQPTGASGNEWETLAFVGEGTATTADALFDQLYYRGYTRAEYTETLNALARRGWLEREREESFRVTSRGREIRTQAETKTDELFFYPWQSLTPHELKLFYDGLETLREALDRFAAQVQSN